jgi:hypothetical protein
MPPVIFSFMHLVMIAMGVMLIIILKGVISRETRKLPIFAAYTIIGGIMGAISGYLLAHVLTPLVQYYMPISTRGIPNGYRFLFWALCCCSSLIFIIIGGMSGILVARKHEGIECGTEKTGKNHNKDVVPKEHENSSEYKEKKEIENLEEMIENCTDKRYEGQIGENTNDES